MRILSSIRPNHRLAALLILLVLPIFIGSPFCSKDKVGGPCLRPECLPPTRKTPTDLLENWFERAYSTKDSVNYEKMLDSEFQFEFLFADAESLRDVIGENNYWGRTLDLKSTGHMLRSPDVGDISLDIRVNQVSVDPQEGCDDCQFVQTNVTLSVVTAPGSVDPLILAVASRQDFYVRKDRSAGADTTNPDWVIWRQYDRETAGGL